MSAEDGAVKHLKLSEMAPELIEVRTRSVYPRGGVEYGGVKRRLVAGERLLVVQDEVCGEIVLSKAREIEAGDRVMVEVKRVGEEVWVFDGHHLLAGYILSGKVEEMPIWERGRGGEAAGQVPRLECGC